MNLEQITELTAQDMAAVNATILEQLNSDVTLINQLGYYIISGGGKRIRPMIAVLAARALGYEGNKHVTVAALIEFIHTATLLHDDVVDESDMRRGKATANAAFGNAASVLVGDFIYTRAFQMMTSLESLRVLALMSEAVNVIADISPNPVNEEGGYATMKLILEAHPNIDVVLGSDTVVLGALRALREAGKARPDQFLGGIDGEPGAVSEIATGESPYKTSIALSSPVFGYALGALAADWLEGKRVPQAMDILPIALTRSNLAAYAADQADPARVYADPARRAAYLRMYGSICYDERDRYLDFPWSSEAH